ncbi:AAA ATPase-like domain-containing protein, nuclease domain-containing [Desulfonema limicola]|uniref:AAA ATPase-like domain-containing protein, nuclease domain-containing n=1 Tax=Desulfonema limicola TaxID=45656 RepID=A0A975GHN6_9BACT|nr:AAA family ATPase [Desulfonema limicola]QTA81720.1 AAA ATPase-like domain-containing protein, nuclease domain-containing [Desulfonema limicola]
MTTKKLPIGLSDFKELIENDYYYIDKTKYIQEIIKSSSKILLLPRPRRFGKTLNLSMLKDFFENTGENHKQLFKGLEIEKHEVFELHQGKYPVIFLTFKDVKHLNWSDCLNGLKSVVYYEYARHRYLIEKDTLFPEEKKYFQQVIEGSLPDADYNDALKKLSMYLGRCYNMPVVILIDEYDTPIHAGYAKGYYEQIISFMRNFLSGGLKDNTYLFKGVLTGILRVAKESVFSGLNNLGVYTLLDKEFNTFFGFTEPETANLLKDYDLSNRFNEVSSWYNGYNFGGEIIYNPWSILQFTHRNPDFPAPYWVNTADTGIIDRLATGEGRELKEEIGQLLEGNTIIKPVYDSIVMKDLETGENMIWSFLLFSGYLKTVKNMDFETWELKVPNEEVRYIYRNMIRVWFDRKVRSASLEEMTKALQEGDIKLFEIMLRKVVIQVMSYHDLGGEPEKVYHALVLGMLVWMSFAYEIRSNRESGYGRYDIMMKPKDLKKHGIIIEFKMVDEEKTPEQTLKKAMEQIEKRKYAAELQASGIKEIIKIAVAFKGKELWIEHR